MIKKKIRESRFDSRIWNHHIVRVEKADICKIIVTFGDLNSFFLTASPSTLAS